jgi:hypothetical protein
MVIANEKCYKKIGYCTLIDWTMAFMLDKAFQSGLTARHY